MSTTVQTGSQNYSIPAYGDTGWAQGAGNLSSYLIALATNKLDIAGGTFTLTADANFGANFGLAALYLKSLTANIATAGFIRMASGDTIDWGTSNNALGISGTALQWNGQDVLTSGTAPTITENRYTFTAGSASGTYTGSLTLVNLAATYVANGVNLKVYLNGLLTAPTLDYTETSTSSFTMNTAMTTGDRIDAIWTTY